MGTAAERAGISPAVLRAVLEIKDGVIQALYVVRNPDKLRHLALPSSLLNEVNR